ncbi:ArnT family glycosyltransferase [Maricaulis parjimensis]|uniref:ArnT family glycosyltransferase n=1 Tax=Maricaulis parjimensis TaxID=144023 RepID=UPI00193AAB43|nr:glycosyltransferase family 39 protein [Maricaulis parjimensis]
MTELARGVRAYVIIGLLAALSALAGIFTLPPLDRDESRFAQATAQMLETGNFVEINFLDTERNKKPVGIHWLQAVSVAALSDAEAREIWAYRIPSLLGVILAALAAFWGGQKLIGREAAFAGAALFATTILLGIEGGIAKTDAMLAGCTTLAMAALMNARAGENPGWKTALLFWFAIGLGSLIKGPVTPMVAGLAIIALLIWEREWRWLKPVLTWWGPILAIAMVVPWLVSIQIATEGNFLREALGDDLGPKLVSGHERHGGPIGYHLLLLPLLLFPATLFLVPGVGRLVGAIRQKTDMVGAARFLVCWAVPTWLVFEILPTKLPHYVLPAYPALALAAGWGLVELVKAQAWQRWVSWGLFAFAGVVFAIVIPVAFVMYGNNASWDAVRLSLAGFQGGFDLGLDPAVAAWVFIASALFIGLTAAALISDRVKPGVLALVFAVLAGLGWQLAARGAALPNAYAVRLADQVRGAREYSEILNNMTPDEIVTASSYTEPSLVFSLGTDTVLGSTEEVIAFAAGREEPTMLVLDLSRDESLLPALRSVELHAALADFPMVAAYDALDVCHRTLASGTNYSRGDETVLAILFVNCGSGYSVQPPRPAGPSDDETNPNDPQD